MALDEKLRGNFQMLCGVCHSTYDKRGEAVSRAHIGRKHTLVTGGRLLVCRTQRKQSNELATLKKVSRGQRLDDLLRRNVMNKSLDQRVFEKMGAEWKVTGKSRPSEDDKAEARARGYKVEPEDEDGWSWELNGKQIGTDVYYSPVGQIDEPVAKLLPPISSQWEVCAKYLVPFMLGEKYVYNIDEGNCFWWLRYKESEERYVRDTNAIIKNHDLALAACEAFNGGGN